MNKQNRRTLIFICFLLLWFLIDTDFSIVSLNDSDFVHWIDSDYLKFQWLA